jgi:hypothetical protein
MRLSLAIAALALFISCAAYASDGASSFRYGPMTTWGDGYKDEVARDGFWKIQARTNGFGRAQAIDVGIYRAAELAKAAGHRYVEIHDAVERHDRLSGRADVTLFARPIDAPVHPSTCRSGKPKRCYTADVELVFVRLSGENMQQPGVAAPSYVDEYGRTVIESGFGTGAVGGTPR